MKWQRRTTGQVDLFYFSLSFSCSLFFCRPLFFKPNMPATYWNENINAGNAMEKPKRNSIKYFQWQKEKENWREKKCFDLFGSIVLLFWCCSQVRKPKLKLANKRTSKLNEMLTKQSIMRYMCNVCKNVNNKANEPATNNQHGYVFFRHYNSITQNDRRIQDTTDDGRYNVWWQ